MDNERYTAAIGEWCEKVEQARARLTVSPLVATLPDPDMVRESLDGVFNRRKGRLLRSAPRSDKRPLANVLWRLITWHRSSGGLGGVYGVLWACDDIVRDRGLDMSGADLHASMDTLAIVLLGGESRAAAAWERAIGV